MSIPNVDWPFPSEIQAGLESDSPDYLANYLETFGFEVASGYRAAWEVVHGIPAGAICTYKVDRLKSALADNPRDRWQMYFINAYIQHLNKVIGVSA